MRPARPASVMGRVLAVACTAPLLVTSLATPATAVDNASVPRKAWITIKGHGYGHGHGMSQYGAQGAAQQGRTFRQIANFYYPGTTWGNVRGSVRVEISADTTDDLVVVARPGLRLRDGGNGPVTRLPANGASRWRISVNTAGEDRVAFLRNNRWRTWRGLEGKGSFSAGGAPVTLVTPSGQRRYRGRLTAEAPSSGSRARDTINTLSLEDYLKGVVPLEMPALWKPAAVQAQAVAARTYAAYEREHRTSPLCDTTSCQVYGGYSAEHPASNQAVERTAHQALMYKGAPAFTQFSSSSGGWTSAGSVPYLPAKADPYDGWAGNPNHSWSTRISDTVIESHWPSIGNLTRITVIRRDGNGQWGGRVGSVRLVGGRGRVVVTGDTLRSVLGLRSTWVTFVVTQRG
jgi:stage II sporulation protein D